MANGTNHVQALALDDIKKRIDEELSSAKNFSRYWNALRYTWPGYLAIIADVVTLIIVFMKASGSSDKLLKIVLILLSANCIAFLALYIYQQIRYSRRGRYAEAFLAFHAAIHRLRDIHKDLANLTELDKSKIAYFKFGLSDALTAVASAFSLVTGTRCRACIKTLVIPDGKNTEGNDQEKSQRVKTTTFCRDRDSYQYHQWEDKPVSISSNSSFRFLFTGKVSPKNRWFFRPNLPQDYPENYDNTSFETYGKPQKIKLFGWFGTWKWRWTIPYRSCIVWPIRALTPEGTERNGQLFPLQDIVGFFAIDSYEINIFSENYDTLMGAAFADALFVFMRDLSTKVEGLENKR